MTEIEELQHKLYFAVKAEGFINGRREGFKLGLEEGAERVRERIRRVAEFTTADNPILNGPLVIAAYGGKQARARGQNIAIVPASVLASPSAVLPVCYGDSLPIKET